MIAVGDQTCIKKGARFFKADLHVHTSASLDYKEPTVKPEEIVGKAVEKGLDIIAVTDHNSVAGCKEIIQKAKGTGLVVLPGVEITVNGGTMGIHILALFDCNTAEEKIRDMLVKIGIDSDKQGKLEALSERTIPEVFEAIVKAGGIAIAAHTDQSHGLTNDCRGQQRTNFVRDINLSAIEFCHEETPKFFDGTDPNYQIKLPCIQSSDSHALDEIGRRVTHLKMDHPCLEGLRQAFLDPDSRVKTDDKNNLRSYPRIVSINVQGGFLDNQEIYFNENLNCLIGGRGTGKTTTIELLRFCLDIPSKIQELQSRNENMVNNVLAEGEVVVTVESKLGSVYKIKRKVGQKPSVYDVKGDLVGIPPSSILQMIAYGEREIDNISFDPSAQLALLDKFIDGSDKFAGQENEIIDKLSKSSSIILEKSEKIIELERQVTELSIVQNKLKELQAHNFGDEIELQKKRTQEKSLVIAVKSACANSLQQLKETLVMKDIAQVASGLPSQEDINGFPNSQLIKEILADFNELNEYVTKRLGEDQAHVVTLNGVIEKKVKTLEENHTQQESAINELFKKLEASGQSDAARIYLELERKKSELEKFPTQIQTLKSEKDIEEKARIVLLNQLDEVRNRIFSKREECARALSTKLGPKISISVTKGGNKTEYTRVLTDALTRSRVHREDVENIANQFNPNSFVTIIKNKEISSFLALGISDHFAEVVVNYEPLRQRLLEIEQTALPDLTCIYLDVGGNKKSLDEVSLGQKCTTLLSLIMLDSEFPLVLDTPEEGLDNMFVFDSVVKNLRAIKEKRQVVIATHNANIPVSGDSELIICLESDGKHGRTSCKGSIDEQQMKERVQEVLEGGKDAFALRKKKYGY